MPRECVATAIINMAERRDHGIARITNYMLTECAKTVISMVTTKKEEKKKEEIKKMKNVAKIMS